MIVEIKFHSLHSYAFTNISIPNLSKNQLTSLLKSYS